MTWAFRASGDHAKQAPPESATKQKARTAKKKVVPIFLLCTLPPQKLAQRDLPSMVDLMEVSCIWSKIQDEMEVHIGRGPALDTIKKAWSEGPLKLKFGKREEGQMM